MTNTTQSTDKSMLIFEASQPGRRAKAQAPGHEMPASIPENLQRKHVTGSG